MADDGWTPVDNPPTDDGWTPVDQPPDAQASAPDDGWTPVDQPSEVSRDLRTAARGVIPAIGGVAGAVLGAGAGAGIGSFVTGAAGAVAGTYLAQKAQDALTDWTGWDTPESRAADAQNPTLASKAAALAPTALALTTGAGEVSLGARLAMGLGSGLINLTEQGVEKGVSNIDPGEALTAAGIGVALPKARPYIEGAVGAAVGRSPATVAEPAPAKVAAGAPADLTAQGDLGIQAIRSSTEYPKGADQAAEGGVQVAPSNPLVETSGSPADPPDIAAALKPPAQGMDVNPEAELYGGQKPPAPDVNPEAELYGGQKPPPPEAPPRAPAGQPEYQPNYEAELYGGQPRGEPTTDQPARPPAAQAAIERRNPYNQLLNDQQADRRTGAQPQAAKGNLDEPLTPEELASPAGEPGRPAAKAWTQPDLKGQPTFPTALISLPKATQAAIAGRPPEVYPDKTGVGSFTPPRPEGSEVPPTRTAQRNQLIDDIFPGERPAPDATGLETPPKDLTIPADLTIPDFLKRPTMQAMSRSAQPGDRIGQAGDAGRDFFANNPDYPIDQLSEASLARVSSLPERDAFVAGFKQAAKKPSFAEGAPTPQAMARGSGRGRTPRGPIATTGPKPLNPDATTTPQTVDLAEATKLVEDQIGSKAKDQPDAAQAAIDAADEKYGRVPLRTRTALADKFAQTWPMKMINPQGIDQSALVAEHDITGQRFYRKQDMFDAALDKPTENLVGALKPEQQREIQYFMDANPNVTKIKSMPDIEPVLRQMRATTKADETAVRTNGTVDFDSFNKNWWTNQFKDPLAASKFRDEWQGDIPSREGKNPPLFDAHANGLDLVNDNPVNALRSKREALFKQQALNNVIQIGKDRQLVQTEPFPDSVKLQAPGMAGRSLYAPEGYATIFNRAYSEGLRSSKIGRQFMDTAQPVVNWGTSMLLSMSAFHPFTMLNEGFVNGVAQGMKQYDDPARMAKTLRMSSVAAVKNTLMGPKGLEEWMKPGTNPELTDIVNELQKVGAKPVGRGGDPALQMGVPHGFRDAVNEIKNLPADLAATKSGLEAPLLIGKATFNTVGAAMHAISEPLFGKVIPNMKMGTFLENRAEWGRTNPDATAEERLAATRSIWKDIENRFGIMNHDNIFWSQGVKDGLNLAMNSMSWSYGFGRNVMSGASDWAFHPSRFSQKSPQYNPNMGSTLALGITTALMSAAYQFLKTGKPPESVYDLMAGQTGGKTSSGQPERAILPGFQKDVFGWLHDPLQEAQNKLGVVPKTMVEMLTGEGWIDTPKGSRFGPIANPKDNIGKQISDRAIHAAKNFMPIGVSQSLKTVTPGSNISTGERMTAIKAAPRFINPGGNKNEAKWQQNKYKTAHPGAGKGYARGGPVDPSNMGPDSREDPAPTQEIEEWREEQQRQKGNPVDTPVGPNDKGVDPVLGWPHQTRQT